MKSALTFGAVLGMAGMVLSPSKARAGGNLQFKDVHNNVVNSVWDRRCYASPEFPDGIPWLLNDQGTRGTIPISLAQLQVIVNAAFETWEAVPEAEVAFTYGGTTANGTPGDGQDGLPPDPGGLDGDNLVTFGSLPVGTLGVTYSFTLTDSFTFDATNNNFGGTDPGPDVPPGTYPAGTILDADIMISTESQVVTKTLSATGELGKYDLQGVLTHEIGHLIGLCHSMIRDHRKAVMHPSASMNPDGSFYRALQPDDVRAITAYYPEAGAASGQAAISGQLSVSTTGLPAKGVHVFVVNAADPMVRIGCYSDPSGNYALTALPPGDYFLRAEPLPLDSQASTPGDRINSIVSTSPTTDFFPVVWPAAKTEMQGTLIHLDAGNVVTGHDFVLSPESTHDLTEPAEGITSAMPVTTDGRAVILTVTGARDRDWLKFAATAGHSYLIETGAFGLSQPMLLQVIAPDGVTVVAAGTHPAGRRASLISYRAAMTGDHYLMMDSLADTGSTAGNSTHMDVRVRQFSPTRIHVSSTTGSDATGSGTSAAPWKTISYAISQAAPIPGHPVDVCIAQGTYPERPVIENHICLRGGFSPVDWAWNPALYPTTIDGGGSGTAILISPGGNSSYNNGGNKAQLHDLILTNAAKGIAVINQTGLIAGCTLALSDNGQGVQLYASQSSVVNCLFTQCRASQGGGLSYEDSYAVILNNLFRDCRAGGGGTIGIGGGGIYCAANVTLVRGFVAGNRFVRCSALSSYGSTGQHGGAIGRRNNMNDIFESNVIVDCHARSGGAMGMRSDSGSAPQQFRGNIITHCTAQVRGGGLQITYPGNNSLFDENLILHCTAPAGGGIWYGDASSRNSRIRNNVFVANIATTAGGAVCIAGGSPAAYVTNNFMLGNVSPGGACFANEATDPYGGCSIINNIFMFSTGVAIKEISMAFPDSFRNNSNWLSPDGFYYDLGTSQTLPTAASVNAAPGSNPSGNFDADPLLKPGPSGSISSASYNADRGETTLTLGAPRLVPGALRRLIVRVGTVPATHLAVLENGPGALLVAGFLPAGTPFPVAFEVVDYHLSYASPNRNAGINVSPETPASDMDGHARPQQGQIDIGPDEYQNVAPAITPVAGQMIPLNGSTGVLGFSISDVETSTASLTVSRTSSDALLLPLSGVLLGGAAESRTVTATPVTNRAGLSQVTLIVGDGETTTSTIFAVKVGSALEAWRQAQFNSPLNSGSGSDTLDIDQDGFTNLMEFALGLDPMRAAANPLTAQVEGGYMRLIYPRSVSAAGELIFNPVWSDTLNPPWSSIGVSEEILSDDGTTQLIRAKVPITGASQKFIRLEVSLP